MLENACPDAETLTAIATGADVHEDVRATAVAHAARCDACAAALETLQAIDTPDDDTPAATPAHTVGRYVIDSIVGAGGMGVVYRAHDPELDRVVALKVLRHSDAAERLKREAQALAKLDHPNVVAVYDVGTKDEKFIAMELVDGDNLRDWLRKERRPRHLILDVLARAGEGLAAAHDRELVHRDLKPDNIFVSRGGQVMVGDFGLVSTGVGAAPVLTGDHGTAEPDLTRSSILGTPAYMAPEQAAGEATAASDQFSFCVTAWEALAGTRPFEGRNIKELLDNVRAGRIIEPPRGHRLGRRVQAVLRRGLRANPRERFASMRELLRELTRGRMRVFAGVSAALVIAATGAALWLNGREQSAAAGVVLCNDPQKELAAAGVAPQEGAPASWQVAYARRLLDSRSQSWILNRNITCMAQRSRGAEVYAQQLRCFVEIKRTMKLVAERLRSAEPISQPTLIALERSMPVERCVRPSRVAATTYTQQALVDAIRDQLVRVELYPSAPGRPQAVEDLYQLARASGYTPLMTDASLLAATVAYDGEHYDVAETVAALALKIATLDGDDDAAALASARLARIHARQNKPDAAASELTVALATMERGGRDPMVELDVLAARADVSRITDAPDAVERQLDFTRMARSSLGANSVTRAVALSDLAGQYGFSHPEQAKEAAAEASRIWTALTAGQGGDALTRAALDVEGAPDIASKIAAQKRLLALYQAQRPGDPQEIIELSALGMWLEGATRWEEGIAPSQRAVELYEASGGTDRQFHFDLLYTLGVHQLESGKLQAFGTFEKAAALITNKIPAPDQLSGFRSLQGRAYELAGMHDKAIEILRPLVEPLRRSKPRRWKRLGLVSASLARALWDHGGERASAMELANEALRAFEKARVEYKDQGLAEQLAYLDRQENALREWIKTRGN